MRHLVRGAKQCGNCRRHVGGGGGESRVRYLGATDSYKNAVLSEKHSTNLTRDKSSRRQFYEKVGDQSLVHNIDSWIVVLVSPVVEVCCVLTTLVKRVSSLIAREKTEEREAVLK